MQLTQKQIDLLNKQTVVVLATASAGAKPRAIFVQFPKVEGDKLIITDNYMGITRKNVLENKKVFVLAFEQDYSYCLKIEGEAEYCAEGEWFDFVVGLEENKKYRPKAAVVISVKNVSEV